MAHRSNNLPALLPSLIGREEALGTLRGRLLEAERGVLTLTGTGGSGKTRLALAVADDVLDWAGFPDGVWLAELAPLSDPSLAAGIVATSVGVKEQPGRPIRDTLVEALRSRSQLLVLDNCEHVVEASASLADDLLRNCPGLRILATSREPLRIPGERVWRVPPLSVPDARGTLSTDELAKNPAVQLFLERAQAVQPGLTLTLQTSQAIAGICARLDGLPLAIELAAARARVLSPEQILDRLDDAFRLLVGGSRTASTRQQTLRATLDWSHQLLGSTEREYFERLAVFAGGFDLDAAEAIWTVDAPGVDPLEILTGLVDRSLVTALPHAGGMRYRLLEPVRQYAQARLTERGAWDAARRRHAAYFLKLVEQGEEGLKGVHGKEWEAHLQSEHDNIRAVLRRCLDGGELETALRISSALRNFWLQFGHRNEGRRWLREALAAASDGQDVSPTVRANAVLTAGVMAHQVGDYRDARPWFEQAVEHWRGRGDPAGLAAALTYYGRIVAATAETPTEYERGKVLMREAIALHRQTGESWWAANGLLHLGISAWEHGELELAAASLREGEAINTQIGDSHAQSHLIDKLGGVLRDRGDLVGAQQLLERSLVESQAINCLAGRSQALYHLAGLSRVRGDPIGAAGQAAECLRLALRVGDVMAVSCVELVGGLACDLGQAEQAARLFSAAAAVRLNMGMPMPPILRPAYRRDLAAARGAIGSRRFDAAWAEGSVMTDDQLVACTRQVEASSSAPSSVAHTDPLSQRERQVVALLARGYTNRRIAEELFISAHTADGHVANILAKLGLSTRAQAAVWAVEHLVTPQ